MADITRKSKTTKTKKTSAKVKTSATPKTARARKTVAPVKESKVEEQIQTTPAPEKKSRAIRIKKSYLFTALAIILFVALLFLLRNLIVAATVNGQPISRLSIISDLEKQGGKQTLDSAITRTLIQQEANKRNITISQKEVDDELKRIDDNLSKQGQKLDQVLTLQGMTKQQLVEQIQLQKMIEKMVGNTTVAEKEIDDYITANQESLPQDQDQKELRNSIKTQLQQQKVNQKAQQLLEDLRKNAKINYFINY